MSTARKGRRCAASSKRARKYARYVGAAREYSNGDELIDDGKGSDPRRPRGGDGGRMRDVVVIKVKISNLGISVS